MAQPPKAATTGTQNQISRTPEWRFLEGELGSLGL